jgi:hypothetical protein
MFIEAIVFVFQILRGFYVLILSKMFEWCLIPIKGCKCDILVCSFFLIDVDYNFVSFQNVIFNNNML